VHFRCHCGSFVICRLSFEHPVFYQKRFVYDRENALLDSRFQLFFEGKSFVNAQERCTLLRVCRLMSCWVIHLHESYFNCYLFMNVFYSLQTTSVNNWPSNVSLSSEKCLFTCCTQLLNYKPKLRESLPSALSASVEVTCKLTAYLGQIRNIIGQLYSHAMFTQGRLERTKISLMHFK